MRYSGPKARLCRREGVNLFGSPKYTKIMQRRNSTPGQKPGARLNKLSEYGRQLREKQKTKRMYGITEKQFQRYFEKATASKGATGERLLQLLELRLDNAIYRAGFAQTRPQARQFVSHAHFFLNGQKADVPSISLVKGDKITVRDRFEGNNVFANIKDNISLNAKWLKVDDKNKTIEVLRLPAPDELEASVAVHMIVEFYSR